MQYVPGLWVASYSPGDFLLPAKVLFSGVWHRNPVKRQVGAELTPDRRYLSVCTALRCVWGGCANAYGQKKSSSRFDILEKCVILNMERAYHTMPWVETPFSVRSRHASPYWLEERISGRGETAGHDKAIVPVASKAAGIILWAPVIWAVLPLVLSSHASYTPRMHDTTTADVILKLLHKDG